MGFSADVYVSILQSYTSLYQTYAWYYQTLDVVAGKALETQNEINKNILQIEENHRKLAEGLSGVVKDLGPVVNSSIRLKHSVDEAKPQLEELVQVTRENAPIIAKDLQALDAKVPGFFTDFNMGIDLANTFMDSANRIASHKIDIPAAARNIGNIELGNAFRDFGVTPVKLEEVAQSDRDTTKFMNVTLDLVPIINIPKEIIQMVQGHEIAEEEKYKPSDYVMGIATVFSGGTIKTVKTIGKVVGTVEDIEKKAKNLEKAAKTTNFTKYPTGFDEVAKYVKEHKKLPDNYITKEQAQALGWVSKDGNLHKVAPGKSMGGNIFQNKGNPLPNAPGRVWYEADINYLSGYRGNDRILYSSDGLVYKTSDHYKTFTEIK